jgi:hypothetical protein
MWFVVIIIVLFILVHFISGDMPTETIENIRGCDFHKWIIKNKGEDDEYMVCEICGLLGGSDMHEVREHGKDLV